MLMEYVLTSAEMKASDTAAIEEYGIGALVLMERAALQTVSVILDRYGTDIYVGVMAGSGNNGGDGIAVARILREQGIRAEINMIGEQSKLSPEAAAQLETARKLNIPIHYGVEHTLYDVIVDAIFGIGITRNVEGKYRKAVEAVNASRAKVVAVDIPSGVHTDDGSIMGCAVKADITVTFAYRKLGLMLYPGASCAGEVVCAPIGIPGAVTANKRSGVVTFTDWKKDLHFPARSRSGNKGTFGKVRGSGDHPGGVRGAVVRAGVGGHRGCRSGDLHVGEGEGDPGDAAEPVLPADGRRCGCAQSPVAGRGASKALCVRQQKIGQRCHIHAASGRVCPADAVSRIGDQEGYDRQLQGVHQEVRRCPGVQGCPDTCCQERQADIPQFQRE